MEEGRHGGRETRRCLEQTDKEARGSIATSQFREFLVFYIILLFIISLIIISMFICALEFRFPLRFINLLCFCEFQSLESMVFLAPLPYPLQDLCSLQVVLYFRIEPSQELRFTFPIYSVFCLFLLLLYFTYTSLAKVSLSHFCSFPPFLILMPRKVR